MEAPAGTVRFFDWRRLYPWPLTGRPSTPLGVADKAVASAWDIGYIPRAGLPVVKRLTKADQLHPKTALVDDDVRPDACHQVSLADDFARTFDQHDQDIERVASQSKRNVSLIKKPFCSKQPKRAE
jgi:hypothetical protein